MGTPQAAVPSLDRILSDGHEIAAVYTQPDRPSGRGHKMTLSPVKKFSLEHGLTVLQPLKIKTEETLATFCSHQADVAVVVAYGLILPEGYLAAFPAGAINVHFSLLPRYRGAAPVNWAIVNGESETGVTTMEMDPGLDTGDILLTRSTAIGADETSISLMDRLSVIGANLLSETLAELGTIVPRAQDHRLATLAPIMKKEDGLIDWSLPARDISNRVRGFQPFPTAFTYIDGTRLTIWQAAAVDSYEGGGGVSGEILEAHGDGFSICCGGGTVLAVDEVQPEGKRRMSVRDFLNGARPQPGTMVGTK